MKIQERIVELNAEEVGLHAEAREIIKASTKDQAELQTREAPRIARHNEIQTRLAAIESERAGIESVQEAA